MADPPPPPKITVKEQTPPRCGNCELKNSMRKERKRYEDLLDEKAELEENLDHLREEGKTVEEDGGVRLLTLQQMEETLPGAWETYKDIEEMIVTTDAEIGELKKAMEKDRRIWEEVIRKRGGWLL
jgi:phage-related tail protein